MQWIKEEVELGFQQLLCLGLERQPALDMMAGTVLAWVSALTQNRAWDQMRDAPRFREAFRTMMSSRDSWPAPKDLVEALPPAPQSVALPAKPSDPARAESAIAEIEKLLMVKK